jgi:hypothetical protein
MFYFLVGILGCSQTEAVRGQDGADGSAGTNGRDGANGLACWDANGDGTAQASEDINADGTWSAADCQGQAARSFSKSDVYVVVARVEAEPYRITASCADVNDILLAGGCTAGDDSGTEYAPQVSFGPVDADSDDAAAGYWCWYSAATGSSHWLEATATCMAVE